MSDMGFKCRNSSSSNKENDAKWNREINLKCVKTKSSHEEHVFDSSSTKSNKVPV